MCSKIGLLNKLLLMLITYFSYYVALPVQFTFTPSPNIRVYQLAHYQCSVDHPDLAIVWFVNGTASTNNDTIQLGIVTKGAGSSSSSFSIPGYPQYNNTIVTCFAAGFVDGNLYTKFDNATLRIQGNTLSDICHYISSH